MSVKKSVYIILSVVIATSMITGCDTNNTTTQSTIECACEPEQ